MYVCINDDDDDDDDVDDDDGKAGWPQVFDEDEDRV
jgi:hypothetical protein